MIPDRCSPWMFRLGHSRAATWPVSVSSSHKHHNCPRLSCNACTRSNSCRLCRDRLRCTWRHSSRLVRSKDREPRWWGGSSWNAFTIPMERVQRGRGDVAQWPGASTHGGRLRCNQRFSSPRSFPSKSSSNSMSARSIGHNAARAIRRRRTLNRSTTEGAMTSDLAMIA